MTIQSIPQNRTRVTCSHCAARTNGFCAALDSSVLGDFATRSFRTLYEKGSEISSQGDTADKIGVIASGLVKVVILTANGDEHLLQILEPGQMIGDLDSRSNSFSWEAATDAVICWMPQRAWDSFLHQHPEHYRTCLLAVTDQLEDMRRSIVKMRGRNALERVACWLFEQQTDVSASRPPRINIALTRRDLASLLDMTVETLCRALHQLDERKIIRLVTPDTVDLLKIGQLGEIGRCEAADHAQMICVNDRT